MKSRSLIQKLNLIIVFLFFQVSVFAASTTSSKWVLTAEKFSFVNKASDSINSAIETVLPTRILDNLGTSLYRTVYYDEQYERDSISLKNERLSLFLQLSSETKKRDNLVLGNYSQKELKEKILEEEEKIQEIKDKLDENLQKQKEYDEKLADYSQNSDNQQQKSKNTSQSELDKYKNLVKNLIKEDKTEVINEEISVLKKNDAVYLYEAKSKEDYLSSEFKSEMNTSKINGFISGKITSYEEFLFVTVELYVYPLGKQVAAISEVGTVDELDYISENLARQLVPSLTNSMPITIQFKIEPEEAAKSIQIFVDNNIIQNTSNVIDLDSGVHFLQFVCNGYRTAETTYFFDGNKKYLVEVNLEPDIQGKIFLEQSVAEQNDGFKNKVISLFTPPLTDVSGTFYVNGMETASTNGKSSISINGDRILGEFIGENGEGAFFYIPENMEMNNALYTVKANAFNRDDYIELHRRKMYNAYSGLVVSLIPYFVSKGLYESNSATRGADWRTYLCKGINIVSIAACIGCGGWFIFELVRYFKAADTVLPEEAEIKEYNYVDLSENNVVSDNETIENEESVN